MSNNYKESFEKMRIAGDLAAQTLDEITQYVNPGIATKKFDKISKTRNLTKDAWVRR